MDDAPKLQPHASRPKITKGAGWHGRDTRSAEVDCLTPDAPRAECRLKRFRLAFDRAALATRWRQRERPSHIDPLPAGGELATLGPLPRAWEGKCSRRRSMTKKATP